MAFERQQNAEERGFRKLDELRQVLEAELRAFGGEAIEDVEGAADRFEMVGRRVRGSGGSRGIGGGPLGPTPADNRSGFGRHDAQIRIPQAVSAIIVDNFHVRCDI